MNPLDKLSPNELVLLFDILKDACRDRLEKNLTNQAFEERFAQQRGPIVGRVDPRPALKRWEPRYRKLLEVASELQTLAKAAEADAMTAVFTERLAPRRRPKRAGSPV
jgi:hypothetical protein